MVLLAVDLILFRLGQVAIVIRHIPLFFVLDMVFSLFQVLGFLRTERAVLDAVRNSLLLILFAAVYLIHTRMVRILYARAGA